MYPDERDEQNLGPSPEETQEDPVLEEEEGAQEAQPEEVEPVAPEPQTPNSVPYDRFQEIVAERNQQKEANERLMRILEQQRQATAQPEKEEEEAYEDPDTAVKKLKQENKQLSRSIGQMADQLDKIDAQSLPGYGKYAEKVEQARQALFQQGKGVFSRREVLYYVKGQEEANKPAPKAAPKAAPEQETPQAIPRTRPAAQSGSAKRPKSLEEEGEDLSNIKF